MRASLRAQKVLHFSGPSSTLIAGCEVQKGPGHRWQVGGNTACPGPGLLPPRGAAWAGMVALPVPLHPGHDPERLGKAGLEPEGWEGGASKERRTELDPPPGSPATATVRAAHWSQQGEGSRNSTPGLVPGWRQTRDGLHCAWDMLQGFGEGRGRGPGTYPGSPQGWEGRREAMKCKPLLWWLISSSRQRLIQRQMTMAGPQIGASGYLCPTAVHASAAPMTADKPGPAVVKRSRS